MGEHLGDLFAIFGICAKTYDSLCRSMQDMWSSISGASGISSPFSDPIIPQPVGISSSFSEAMQNEHYFVGMHTHIGHEGGHGEQFLPSPHVEFSAHSHRVLVEGSSRSVAMDEQLATV